MAKKKNKRSKDKNSSKISLIKKLLLIGSLVVIAILVIVFAVGKLSTGKYTKTIPKEVVRDNVFGEHVFISNPRALSNPTQFSDSFLAEDVLDQNGGKLGSEVTIIIDNPSHKIDTKRIPQTVAILLIVDNDLKIKALTPFNPTYFDLGVPFQEFFKNFEGKDAESIIKGTDGIDTKGSSIATIIKNKVREALSFLYIEKYGMSKFNSLGVTGYIFAEKGTKLEPVTFKDVSGREYNLSSFKNEKFIIIGGNPNCGACVEGVTEISNYLKTFPNANNIKIIVFAFTDSKDDLLRLTSVLQGDVIGVLDADRSIASKLGVSSSPSIELVDHDLTVFYRGPGEGIKETLDNIKEFLSK